MTATPLASRVGVVGDGLLLAAGLLSMMRTPPFAQGDGQVRFDAMRSLLDGDVPQEKYSLVMPLFAMPLGALGRLLGREQAVAYLFNGIALSLGVLVVVVVLHRVVGPVVRPLALLLVFASMFPAAVASFYGETLTAVGLLVGLLLATTAPAKAAQWAGWAIAVVAVVNTPAALPAFALVVLVQVVRTRRLELLLLIPVAVGLALVDLRLHVGALRSPYGEDRGYPTVLTYSGRPGFSFPAPIGIAAILFSFGKGLLFFAPGMFLSMRHRFDGVFARLRSWYVASLAMVIGLVLVYCQWWAWYGGYFWGPRFFLFASCLAALVLAVRLVSGHRHSLDAAATLTALTLSTWVAISSVLGNVGQDLCLADDYSVEFLCWYSPEFSVLWHPVSDWPPTTGSQRAYIALALVVHLRLAWPLYARLGRDLVAAARAAVRGPATAANREVG